jgi:hypothetical protein
MSHKIKLSLLFGVFGTTVWLGVVTWALISYPHNDNLLIGWPIWIAAGDDGMARLSHRFELALMLALAQTIFVFIAFATLGSLIPFIRRAAHS